MDAYHELARLYQALAHPVRLRILDILSRREACVCHLTAVLGQRQPYVSQQLTALRDAGSTDTLFAGTGGLRPATAALLVVLVALLLSGTFKIPLLTNAYATVTLPVTGADRLQTALYTAVPFDAARGEEGVTAQGAALIALLGLLGLTAWLGIERIHAGVNRWARGAAALMGLTLVAAALGMTPRRRDRGSRRSAAGRPPRTGVI